MIPDLISVLNIPYILAASPVPFGRWLIYVKIKNSSDGHNKNKKTLHILLYVKHKVIYVKHKKNI